MEELHLVIDIGAQGSHLSACVQHSQNILVIRHVSNHSNDRASHGSVVALVIEENSDIRCATSPCLWHLPFKKWLQWSLAERHMLIFHDLQLPELPLVLYNIITLTLFLPYLSRVSL